MNAPRNDDEKFEGFLRQFHPRAPRPLRIEERPARREYVFGLVAATATVALVAAVLVISRWPTHTSPPDGIQTVGIRLVPKPLTLGRANTLLMEAPSISAALDSLAVESETTQEVPKGARSALATLEQANFKEIE